jgi:protein CpxP
MFHSKLFIILVVISVVAAGCCHRFYRNHCMPSHKKAAQWIIKKLSKNLDLNEEQKKELNRIKDEISAKHQQLKSDHQEILNAVLLQIKNDKVDEAALNEIFDSKEEKIKEMRSFLIAKLAEFHSILTPAQRDKLAQHIKKYHDKCNQE